eukprot:Gb_30708 [translate_table: standard]
MLVSFPLRTKPFLYNTPNMTEAKYKNSSDFIESTFDQRTNSKLVKALILDFVALGADFLILIDFFLYLYYNHLKSNRTTPYDLTSIRIQRFTFSELKVATSSFNPTQKLGKGGFGVVYKGILPNDKEVVVKKLDFSSLQGEREFQNELSIIGRLRSPFMLSLLGYCADGNKRRLLMYEHMQNRSLQEALFENSDFPCKLVWEKRFNIILDVAQALASLHLECDPPIIHGDVKPNNVLLDSNFNACIVDFGLARIKCDDFYYPVVGQKPRPLEEPGSSEKPQISSLCAKSEIYIAETRGDESEQDTINADSNTRFFTVFFHRIKNRRNSILGGEILHTQ